MERDHSFWPSTEVGLIRRLENADDNAAWAVFVERYRPPIRRTALRAGLSDTEAEEVVQSTWLAVLKSLATYNPQLCRFRTWLGGIVRNRIHEQVRGRKGEPLHVPASPDSTTCLERQHPDLVADPYLPFEEEEERELDTRAWERLKREISLRHWQVLYDLVARGRSVKEVANKYGYRPITVYVIKQRDLPKLREVRQKLDAEEDVGLLGPAAASTPPDRASPAHSASCTNNARP